MIEWALKARNIVPDEIAHMKEGPGKKLQVPRRNLQNTDLFEGIQ